MKVIVIFFCLFCAIFANPITIDVVLDSSELNTNSTENVLLVQASRNETSEVQSSESESSESLESASSDSTSEESDSVESNEHTEMLVETRDDSMGSEENVRKSWVRVFATVVQDSSVEDNRTEVKGPQPEVFNKLAEKQPIQAPTVKTSKQSGNTVVSLLQRAVSGSSSESAESTEHTALMTATAASSESLSSESNETSSSSEASDSASDSAQSSESDGSDSAELNQIKHCVNGTQSCESQEYFFQDIGDDANYSVDNLMVPEEDDRQLILRR